MEGIKINLAQFGTSGFDTVKPLENLKPSRSFGDILKDAVADVNDLQVNADSMVKKLALGDVNDVSEVVLSVQKAEMALKMLLEIRNKLVDSYEQLGRISV